MGKIRVKFSENGEAAIEYAAILGFIAIVVIGAPKSFVLLKLKIIQPAKP